MLTQAKSASLGPLLVAYAALLASACTTVMYGGARRPRSEVALIKCGSGTAITAIDRRPVEDGAMGGYEVLPGDHHLVLKGSASENRTFYTAIYTSRPAVVCLTTHPGRTYLVKRRFSNGRWDVIITDTQTGEGIEPVCSGRGRTIAPLLLRNETSPAGTIETPVADDGMEPASPPARPQVSPAARELPPPRPPEPEEAPSKPHPGTGF